MAEFLVKDRPVFIDHESGRIRDRKKAAGQVFKARLADVKHLVEAGQIEQIKKAEPKPKEETADNG